MRNNIFNKVFVLSAVLSGVFLYGKVATACELGPNYTSCMEEACASQGKFYNGSVCVGCVKGLRPSQKLQACIDKNMTEEEEEKKYKESNAAKEAEKEQRRATGCRWFQSFDEDQGKCVTDFEKLKKGKEATEGEKAQEEASQQTAPQQVPPANENTPGVTESAASGATGDGSSGGLQVTTTTKTITNEGETVETKTGDLASLGASGTEAAADAAATEQASQGAEEAAEKAKEEEKQKEEEKEDLSKYTGLYNDRHIMPDEMAKHCRITGEEVAKDPEKFIKCIKQYVSEMNNPNATAKAEAEREYEMLKYKFLTDAGATAINKSATVNNNEDVVNGISSAQGDGRTESDDNKGIMASILIATNVMNDVRELLVEQLKYDVVSGIGDIDPAIIMENEEPKEEKKDEEKSASGSETKGPEYKVTEIEKKVENKSE